MGPYIENFPGGVISHPVVSAASDKQGITILDLPLTRPFKKSFAFYLNIKIHF